MANIVSTWTGTLTGGKLTVNLFNDGRIFVSGYGNAKPTYTAIVTYWAAVPAVVGLTKTAFGLVCAAGLLPNGTDLTNIGTTVVGSTYITALLANAPAYFNPF